MFGTQVGSVFSIILMALGLMAMVVLARRAKQGKKPQEAEIIDDDCDPIPRRRRF